LGEAYLDSDEVANLIDYISPEEGFIRASAALLAVLLHIGDDLGQAITFLGEEVTLAGYSTPGPPD
jgi:hypothetical protein